MPGPADFSGKPKANNVYTQKVVVKQAARNHLADQLQDAQKQRLLQPDSPKISDSPRNSISQRPQHLQPLPSHSPRQAQLQQQLQQQSPQQSDDKSDDWDWPQSSPGQQAFQISSQSPATTQLAQNGSPNSAQTVRPRSASSAERAPPEIQDRDGSQQSTSSRPRTATGSPRVTNETLASIRAKNVSWQDAQGENLCQYREFEPSDAADSDEDDTDWHAQKKGCCMIM